MHRSLKLGKETFVGSGEYSKKKGQFGWDRNVAPNLKKYTNYAEVHIPGQAIFGSDRKESYLSWVNKGYTKAQDLFIDSDYVENTGSLESLASVDINANHVVMQDGNINTGESLIINAENLKMRFQTNKISKNFVLNISNVISDGGEGANNVIL